MDSDPTTDELFAELGQHVLGADKFGMSVSDSQKAQLGRRWFDAHLEQIKGAVCGNKTVEDIATKGDTATLVAAISPLFGFSPSAGASMTIAVLVARIGIRRICSSQWTLTQNP